MELVRVCCGHYGESTVRRGKMVFVEGREVFTKTGRRCILLSNGISLVFPQLGDRCKEFS